MHLFQEILDQQLIDRNGCEMGRVDGIVVELRDGAPPRVVKLETGFVVLARRIGARFERLAERMHDRMRVRRSARYGIEWELVLDRGKGCVTVDVRAEETPAYDWERWIRDNIITRIPGSSRDE